MTTATLRRAGACSKIAKPQLEENKTMEVLPVPVNAEIHLRSRDRRVPKVAVKILGARHGEFIMIDNPVARLNERFTIEIEGDVLCWFSHDGVIYGFQSKIQERLSRNMALLEYPLLVQTKKTRRHRRIRVDIEASLAVDGLRQAVRTIMEDVSEGGCNLSAPPLIPVTPGTDCKLDFALPDGQGVSALKCEIQRINQVKTRKVAKLGMRFVEPAEELLKVASFCRFRTLFAAVRE